MATHSSTLAWEISETEETGGLQSMGHERVGHDLVTRQQQNNGFVGISLYRIFLFNTHQQDLYAVVFTCLAQFSDLSYS